MSKKDNNQVSPERKTSKKSSLVIKEKNKKYNLFENFLKSKLKIIKTKDSSIENNNYNSESDDYNSIELKHNEEKEKQLEVLNIKYSKIYNLKERKFASIVNEIEQEESLFYKKSLMSFDLIIIKIKCFLKVLKEKITNFLSTKIESRNFYEIDLYIQKVKSAFNQINSIIDKNNKYEYEIITQIYSKFLYIMSNICLLKDDFVKSLSYISLGINMLRVFFVRREVATDIETYKIYAKLLLMLISKLILDKNIPQSLIYINFLSRLCEIALNIIESNKLSDKYQFKFLKYMGYNFLLCGYCFEINNKGTDNFYDTLEAYKESYYFLNQYFNKTKIPSIFHIKRTTIDNMCLYLASSLYDIMKEKARNEALEIQRKYERQKAIKRHMIEEEKLSYKKYKLKLVSSGLTSQIEKCKMIENKLYTQILTKKNQALIDKLDSELVSYAYKDDKKLRKREKNNNSIKLNSKSKSSKKNKKKENTEKKLPSINIMKNLSRFKIYNSLMSSDFRDFIANNNKLAFNNPEHLKSSMEKIQRYFNHKIEMDSKVDKTDKDKTEFIPQDIPIFLKTENDANKSKNSKTPNKINTKINKNNKLLTKREFSVEQISPDLSKINNIYSTPKSRPTTTKFDKRNLFLNININSIGDKYMKKRNNTFSNYNCICNYRSNSNANFNKKYQDSKSLNIKSKSSSGFGSDFDIRKFDKYTFSKNYFQKYQYLENLTNKELDFQKKFLEMKNNNSKLYFKRFYDELNTDGTFSNDELYKSFLILHNNATYRAENFNDYKAGNDANKPTKIIGNIFKSVTKGTKEGRYAKNILKRVFQKYIKEKKKNQEKKKLVSNEVIVRRNHDSIMMLSDNIKTLNNKLISKKKAIKDIINKSK